VQQRVASRLTAKSQTTIPRAVRDRLALQPGDTIVYEIEDDGVRLRKEAALDIGWLRALEGTLGEWESPDDAQAYDDL
jgi:antitoxin PrlF